MPKVLVLCVDGKTKVHGKYSTWKPMWKISTQENLLRSVHGKLVHKLWKASTQENPFKASTRETSTRNVENQYVGKPFLGQYTGSQYTKCGKLVRRKA